MEQNYLLDIASWRGRPGFQGIPSICSAHPIVIEAAMLHAARAGSHLLIEATCNQVNQDGGYTGMTPADFRKFVEKLADKTGFPLSRIILGGDHLGPNPWKHLPAEEAMDKAVVMIEAFATAGFTKLHLDTSMGCLGEPAALADAVTASRAARLAAAAESVLRDKGQVMPVYIVGTEVPIPGGAMEELGELEITSPEAAVETIRVHEAAFRDAGAADALQRVVAAVVQPGVEFGNHNVIAYIPDNAAALSASLANLRGLVFEAHSTDYQTRDALRSLVSDGFAILKVGPGLTFALREAFYALDLIAAFLFPDKRSETLASVIERVMLQDPKNWEKYYHGSPEERHLQRHFSYSDRMRYYWPHPEIAASVDRLFEILDGVTIPETMISQYMQGLYWRVRAGTVKPEAKALAIGAVDIMLEDYFQACRS
jgi:D-tagatose-1,6-bisphosphate aldolase subunit GatZ/KbaZ